MWQLPASGQNSFAPIGAEWWHYMSTYLYHNGSQNNSTFHTRSVGDTTINGIACRKLTTEASYLSSGTYQPDIEDFFFYDNTDTVFVYNKNFERFTPIYVFNAEAGDTICLPVPPTAYPMPPGDSSFRFVIDSIRPQLYDTAHLRTYYTTAIPGTDFGTYSWVGYTESPADLHGVYIERIIGNFFPVSVPSCVDCPIFSYAPYGAIRCYSDNTYSLRMFAEPCDTLHPLDINRPQTAANILKLYPNPAAQQFHILLNQAMDEDLRISITDIAGRVVQQTLLPKKTQQKTIDVHQWTTGLYFLRFQAKEGFYYDKIVIRNNAGQ